VRSAKVPRCRYCPIYGGVGCISYWVFITPWCGMEFCSTTLGVVVAHIVVGPAKGRRCWGMWSISKFLHLFKVSDLREIVSIMAILTTKGTREVFLNIIFILLLAFVIISPLGVWVPLILVAPDRCTIFA
jgi:hypothetical protein